MTSTTWKLKELEQWVETNRPEDKQAAALPRSLSRSSFIIKYHGNLAKEACAEFNKESDNHRSMMVAMLSLKPDFAISHTKPTLLPPFTQCETMLTYLLSLLIH